MRFLDQQNRNGMISDLLTTGATVYGMSSSKKVKDRGGKVDGLAAVKAVEKSPAEHWRYKPGQGDGSTQQRMGPMAEDLKKAAPQVSDGKKVDMIALVGLQHAAIGGLSKRLAGIEKKLGGLADARRKAAWAGSVWRTPFAGTCRASSGSASRPLRLISRPRSPARGSSRPPWTRRTWPPAT